MAEQEKSEENNLSTVLKYFDAWNNHDLNRLCALTSVDITLEDWEIQAIGRDKFLNANEKIFSDNDGINAKLINSFVNAEEVIAILEITIPEGNEKLAVIDHFKFSGGKISQIKAYRGF